MDNHTQEPAGGAAVAVRPVRHRRRRGPGRRAHVVRARLADTAFEQAQTRAARADLALAAWLVELGLDVALARPALTAEQLDALAGTWERLRRVGAVLNAVAKAENGGRAVPDPQLSATLDRVLTASTAAADTLNTVAPVFTSSLAAPTTANDGAPRVAGEPWIRRPPTPGMRRDRVVITRLSSTELDVLAGAAVATQLSVGGWLGWVAEAPPSERPAVLREQYRAVERVRTAARRLRTNLGQVADARTARRAGDLPGLTEGVRAVDDLLRTAFRVRGLVAATAQSGQ